MSPNDEHRPVSERAAEWLQRLRTAGPKERAAFVGWLKASREHVREILLATAWDRVTRNADPAHRIDIDELVSAASNVIPVPGNRPAQTNTWRMRHPKAWLTVLAAGISGITLLLIISQPLWRQIVGLHQYTTSTGEQRSIELSDGSVISLNTQSSVRVDFSRTARDAYLKSGQAIFVVAHEAARPFRVHAGESIVQAIGTKFEVRRLKERTNVAVIEGRVRIGTHTARVRELGSEALAEGVKLAAGETASITVDGLVTPPAPINVTEIAAWQQRRLIFRDKTLLEIVEEFARYNRTPQIRIESEALREKRFSGVFDADNPEALIELLSGDHMIAVKQHSGGFVIASRAAATEPPDLRTGN